MIDFSKCPKCGGKTATYRHMYAKVWCSNCGFTLREEGEGKPVTEPCNVTVNNVIFRLKTFDNWYDILQFLNRHNFAMNEIQIHNASNKIMVLYKSNVLLG